MRYSIMIQLSGNHHLLPFGTAALFGYNTVQDREKKYTKQACSAISLIVNCGLRLMKYIFLANFVIAISGY